MNTYCKVLFMGDWISQGVASRGSNLAAPVILKATLSVYISMQCPLYPTSIVWKQFKYDVEF